MNSIRAVIAATAMLAWASMAGAQVPPEIAAKVRSAGQAMDPSAGELYAPMFAPERWDALVIERDVAYGPDPLHTLDIYAPREAAGSRPVLLFVHGGGFTRGDKQGEFYPDNITLWAAEQEMVGVNINYRLAPKDPWPAGARDLASAIAWTRENIARYGGDPDRIVLWGHSAGANHVADYVAHPSVQGPEFQGVKGAVLLSPNYALTPASEPNVYYGSDETLQSADAAIERLRQSRVPLFLAVAEFDPDPFRLFGEKAREELCRSPERCPRYLDLADHNHFTEGMAVGTADQSLTGPLLEWIRTLP